ncbi:MAG: hypothetical protein LAP39_29740 [Acidobacteriia bacterium]|nr:hypothetical protein [Terriglobia bacterium]
MSKKNLFVALATLCFASSFLPGETYRISPDRYYTTFSAHPPIARGWPRVEHPDSIVTLGCAPDAMEHGFRSAISEMVAWLTSDYGLSPQEAHVTLGMAADLRVASWFGTYICKVPKKYLPASKVAQPFAW